MIEHVPSLQARPHQLLHIIARAEFYSIGSGVTVDLKDEGLNRIWAAVRCDPFVPITLRCNTESCYGYQNPGHGEDTGEGRLFNLKRDLDILHRLGLFPGATKPARGLFARILERIPTGAGILWYERATSPAWRGSSDPAVRAYDRAVARGLSFLFPKRSAEERAASKLQSVKAIQEGDTVKIRPHHLMCATCSYGYRLQGLPEDREEDNRFEIIDLVRSNPDMPVTLIPGCCMVCPPCPHFDPDTGACSGADGDMMLRDQKKDLDLLQLLGLEYGDTLPARTLLDMIFRAVRSATQICGFGDGVVRSPEWTFCGGPLVLEDRHQERQAYILGRQAVWGLTGGGSRAPESRNSGAVGGALEGREGEGERGDAPQGGKE